MIRVFYDGKCGMYRSEIDYYRRIAAQNIFYWIDIRVQPKLLPDLGLTVQDGLKKLHMQDHDGKIHCSLDSFLIIWQQIPRLRWLYRLCHIRPAHAIVVFLYEKFATWYFTHMGDQKCDI